MEISDVSSDKSEHISSEKSDNMSSNKAMSLPLRQCSMMTFSAIRSSVPYRVSGHGRIWMHHSDVAGDCSDFSQIQQFSCSSIISQFKEASFCKQGKFDFSLVATFWHFRTSTLHSSPWISAETMAFLSIRNRSLAMKDADGFMWLSVISGGAAHLAKPQLHQTLS